MDKLRGFLISLLQASAGLLWVGLWGWVFWWGIFGSHSESTVLGILGQVLSRPSLFIYYTLGYLVFRDGPLESDPDIAKVSGFYGPGTYWAWVLGMVSVATAVVFDVQDNSIHAPPLSGDFVVCMVYAIASSIHFYQRAYALSLGGHALVQDVELQAAMHVLYMAIPFFAIGMTARAKRTRVIWIVAYIMGGGWGMPLIWGDINEKLAFEEFYQGLFALWNSAVIIMSLGLKTDVPKYIKIGAPIVLFVHFGLLELGGRRPTSFPLPFLTPHSGASLSDLDQVTAFASAVLLLAYQWKLWRLPGRALQFLQRKNRSSSSSSAVVRRNRRVAD